MVRRTWIWGLALATALAFDYLFWKHGPGISFFIFVAVCLTSGVLSAAISGARPSIRSAVLIPCILLTAAITFLRSEPFSMMCAAALTLVLMMILVYSYRGGKWPFYGIVDHVIAVFRLGASAALHPALLPAEKPAPGAAAPSAAWRRWLPPVLRGLVLALPVILLFAALLSSADPVFGKMMNTLFNIDQLPEYIFRLTYILAGTYLLVGVFLFAILSSREEGIPSPENSRLRPFIGFIEAVVVLGCVSLLFAVFVIIQFRYFFGGVENITAEGFTYAEYARRGFGELLAVALISLLLFLGLGSLTRKEDPLRCKIFSALGIVLVAMVSVILVSAYRRLLLYENAYGFTGLRLYTQVFMVWLGILLIGVAGLEIAGRIRWFNLAVLVAVFGFTLSLAGLNVDATIVRWNGGRAVEGGSLDVEYLDSLSADAVPALLVLYAASTGSEKDALGSGLACRLQILETRQSNAWQSYTVPGAEALRLLKASPVGSEYPVQEARGALYVTVGGKSVACPGQLIID
ncbi:MAG: DUF4173 domain-containing protein [Anaerolineales bacterium]